MHVADWMQPRNPRTAARSMATLSGVAATTAVLTNPLRPHTADTGAIVLAAALVAATVAVGWLLLNAGQGSRVLWAVAPVAATVVLAAVDVLTQDATLTAQIFFLFPVLYAASQLRWPGVVVVTALAFAGEVVVVATQLPAREAVIEAWYVGAAMGATAAVLAVGSERQARLVARLEELARIDPLTGLATRRVLDRAAATTLARLDQTPGAALVLLDVDHFKGINDGHGHPTGDAVLVQLAEVLRTRSRASDVLCRLGGDEIAVLMPGCSPQVAQRRAEEMLDGVRQHTFRAEEGEELAISVSMGCAHAPAHATDLRTLYAAADGALYAAKQAGRDRVLVASGPSTTDDGVSATSAADRSR